MAEKSPPLPSPPPSDHSQAVFKTGFHPDWRKYAALKVSTEYDSEDNVFINKISARLLNGLAKLKASFHREPAGELRSPMLGFASRFLSVLYDHEERNALVTGAADLGSCMQFKYLRDMQARQGEVKLIARSTDSRYLAEIGCDAPITGMPRASILFPYGEVKLEEEQREETSVLSVSGFVGGRVRDGLLVGDYRDENLSLKYKFKDEEMTIAPTISLTIPTTISLPMTWPPTTSSPISWPSKALSLAFKRQFNPANKLSYLYNFNSAVWSAVYKHQPREDFKFKAGYDSDVRIAWASAWVGKEDYGAKKAPRKLKLQIMLQIPQDNVRSSVILFKVKKRWDL